MILAIDPGKVTGVALWTPNEPMAAQAHEVDDRYDMVNWVNEINYRYHQDLDIVVEDFIISDRTIKTALDVSALRIIGWLDLWCFDNQVPLTIRPASAAKKFATDDKLKALGWWDPTEDGHANDAYRHLLVHIRAQHRDVFNDNILPTLAKVLLNG